MKKILIAVFAVVISSTWIASCSNDSQTPSTGQDASPTVDSLKVDPPTDKRQDTTSVTDTSHSIGDEN